MVLDKPYIWMIFALVFLSGGSHNTNTGKREVTMHHSRWIVLLYSMLRYFSTTDSFFFNPEDESSTLTENDETFNTLATPSLLFDALAATSCQKNDDAAGFKLYTRYARNEGECIRLDDGTLKSSYFNKSHKTMFFIHGYLASGDDWYVNDLKNSLVDKESVNFIAVDWSVGSWQLPMFAMLEVESVALIVSDFIRNLTILYGISARDMHVIGHSLGGRVAGKVGANLEPKLGRITVLDPFPGDYRESAEFVDVIHATFLSDWAQGDVQFFPNNGRMSGYIPWSSAHIKSIYLYQHSVIGQCKFKAYQCDSYKQFTNHECDYNDYNYLGHYASSSLAHGKLFLTVNDDAPFCLVDSSGATTDT